MSRITLILCCLGALAIISAGCKEELTASHRPPGPMTLDGQTSDWEGIPALIYGKERATLRICNDDENLYLLFETGDPRTARMVRFTGITLYLDKSGKKSKNFFVRFKGGPSEMRGRGPREGADRRDGASAFEMDFDTTTHFICFEKDNIIEKEIPTDGGEGPAIAYSANGAAFVYEFRIPLSKSIVRYYGIGALPADKIGVGLIWGDRSAFQQNSSGRGFSGGRGTGIGSPTGGGGRGSGGPGARSGRGGSGGGRGFEKQEVWFKTRLAPGPVAN